MGQALLADRELAVPGDGDGFDPRVDAERPEQMADVVADGLRAEMELA